MNLKEQIEKIIDLDKKRTPGKWESFYSNDVGDEDGYFVEFYQVDIPKTFDGLDNIFASDILFKGQGGFEKEEDAKFAAKAPEMLEIIKKQQEIIESCKIVFEAIAESSTSPAASKAAANTLTIINQMEQEND